MLHMPEYRIMLCSNSDGLPYTEQEFIEFFGPGRHLNHWSNSMPVHIFHRNGSRCRWMLPPECPAGFITPAPAASSSSVVAKETSVVAKRKLKLAKCSVDTCSITNALSGNEIVKFDKVLPYLFIPEHFHQRLCLDAARVVWADGTTSTLKSFTFTSETKDVRVVLGAMLPRDVWDAKKPGWRKWYKEFRVFAENAFPTDTFKDAPLRELVPLILQAFVDQERERLGDINGVLPKLFRGWEGAYHSIVLRTEKRATLQEVRAWVDDWLAANKEVLDSITEVVKEDPCRQYFA